ncbi:Imm8 family immunity protein [Roseovarius indicus]|uniref:Uncharacterized protein n=1 Tax=Roseovarius indicus TaxID=540747 RepID=A0A0T5P6R3_9RHOB|nr:Imm8 family immunity protein [Roseovarius indicus]KRS16758.1 hypothetical protein XM52_16110 [Roseovarius indicus]QEW24350.1 hypothetical protein RIdsm_00127 [Roseovarius indicus]SFD72057.1 Immunity protein 8 [Roseovarius indicus]
MLDPEVKSIDWVDAFPPNDGSPAVLPVTASIGERGNDAADNFQLIVCNSAWIASQVPNGSGLWQRGMLIVETITPGHIQKTLEALVYQFRRSHSWTDFTERLSRYLLWEYEDYNVYMGEPVVP